MRIIAGSLKGRRLAGPRGPEIRPTSDSLRETLFNVLGDSANGAVVLDAFAGTGAVGLEALSRGAARVTFLERDRRAVALIRDNIRRCAAENACVIVERDLSVVRTWPRQFDLIFLDPPYGLEDLPAAVASASAALNARGRLVLEHSKRRVTPEVAGGLRRTRLLTAGDSALSFYET
jgi:16S rRNA (guanine(966)-N(2))-methyltransferase RsmD